MVIVGAKSQHINLEQKITTKIIERIMAINWKTYQALELIPDELVAASVSSQVQEPENFSWLRRLWTRLTTGSVQQMAPFVWKTTSRSGHTYWNIFDTRTGRTTLLMSEEEFDSWLRVCRFKL